MTWKRGESGNPSGRPRKTEAQAAFENNCRAWVNEYGFAKLTEAAASSNPRVAIWALRELLDRAFGKSVISAAVEVQEGEARGLSAHEAIESINALLEGLPDRKLIT